MGGRGSCWHCGIPFQRAAQYIGILDVILGGISFTIMTIHVKEMYEMQDQYYKIIENYQYQTGDTYVGSFPRLARIPRELAVVILVASGIQLIMGVALYFGAVNKSRSICQFWLVITALTAIFTGVLLRIWEMVIVNEFSRELREEHEVTYFTGQQPQPEYQQQQHQQQLPYGPPPPPDKYHGVLLIPPVGPSTISGGNNGYSQYGPHQYQNQYPNQQHPMVATPMTGNVSQYSPQLPYNPGSGIQGYNPNHNLGVPTALQPQPQPPPQYEAVEEVGGYQNPSFTGIGMYPNIGKESEANGFRTSFAKY